MHSLARFPAFVLRVMVHAYRFVLSPLIGPCCRFIPSCSEYALEALHVLPLWKALPKITWRLLRCHPWGSYGFDPVVAPDDACPTHIHSVQSHS